MRPRAESLLHRCQRREMKVIMLTNAHPDVIALKMSYQSILHYFDLVISSHNIGYAKEKAGFWQKIDLMYGIPWHHSIFIDDSEPVLTCAPSCFIETTDRFL